MKKVSLKDIADQLGVSIALVSYALNDQKQGRIKEEVRKKIKSLAKELNYRPNQIAKSLKTKKTNTIGLIVADIANPFFSTIARYIEDEASKYNYTVIFGSSDENPEKSLNLINVFSDRQVDGLIIALTENASAQLSLLKRNEIPYILFDRYNKKSKENYVVINNYKAANEATAYLIRSGCKRIGFISYKTGLFHLQERKRGYLSALERSGLKEDNNLIKELNYFDSADTVANAIDHFRSLKKPADAILFTNNILSFSGLKHLNSRKVSVPGELSIISFDESDAAELFVSPLSYIKQPLEKMAQLAMQTLLSTITGGEKTKEIILDAELVIRKSTKPVTSKS